MPALVIRRRRPIGEPPSLAPAPGARGSRSVASTLDGTLGAGRICQVLAELGVPLGSVVQLVLDPEASLEVLDTVDIGRTFDTVALASHLVNTPEDGRRSAFLRLAARHLAPGAVLLVEHHPIDWAEAAEPTRPTPGAEVGMVGVRRDPPFVSAVSVYDIGGRVVRQPFRARVLSETELDEAAARTGLMRVSRRGPSWLELGVRRPGAAAAPVS